MAPYLLQNLYRRLGSPALRLAAIQTARAFGVRHLVTRIDTNDVCNLRCVMCPLSEPGRVPAAKPMPIEAFTRIADDLLPRTRHLYLSCSTEPLATPHFDQVLDVVARYRVPFVSYCTNGHLLRDRFIDATLRAGVNEVIFSVDGATAPTYEAIRIGGKWHNLEDRLRAFTDARRAHRGRRPEVRMNYTVQDSNCHELLQFVEWARQWDVTTLQFRIFRQFLGAVKQTDGPSTIERYAQSLPALTARCHELGIRLLVDPPAARAPAVPAPAGMDELAADQCEVAPEPVPTATATATAPAVTTKQKVGCRLPWVTVYVKADGSLFPCAAHPSVGNIFAHSYREIERQEPMATLRQSLRSCAKQHCVDCQRSGADGL
ncbi:MAG: radical SAM protein [Planctomycetota bacterium]